MPIQLGGRGDHTNGSVTWGDDGDGQSLPSVADAACEGAPRFERSLRKQFIVAVCTTLITMLPMLILQTGLTHKIVYSKNWTITRQKRTILKWRIQLVFVWLLCCCYLAAVTIFIAAFLANISRKDIRDFAFAMWRRSVC